MSWNMFSVEMYWLGIGMNLYVISENCDVNKLKSLLVKMRDFELVGGEKFWNGIIFVDGRLIDYFFFEFYFGYIIIFCNGIIFVNGIVLEIMILNFWI